MNDRDASPSSNHRPRKPIASRQVSSEGKGKRVSSGLAAHHTAFTMDGISSSAGGHDSTSHRQQSSDDMDPLEDRRAAAAAAAAAAGAAAHTLGSMNEDERHHPRGGAADRTQLRTHKRRTGGSKAFLLSDPLLDAPSQEASARAIHGSRRHRNGTDHHRSKNASGTADKARSSDHANTTPGGGGAFAEAAAARTSTETRLTGSTMANPATSPVEATHSAMPSSPVRSTSNGGPLDMESAQIVNMALNLSESRRLASRRKLSQATPPKLVPLPDSTTGGSLRQHLQQQRRISRNISPRRDLLGSRVASSARVSSPLQAAFDPTSPEGGFRYHFSQSTLGRAQKAKDYLDLLAQYRRLVDLIPPLKPDLPGRSSTHSPPGSPRDLNHSFSPGPGSSAAKLGRPYNPLQYIRNRKVRARERKAIDGEGQGFNDVYKVTEWVDEVADGVALVQLHNSGGALLPPFARADEMSLQNSPPPGSRAGATVLKPKRPRVDWFIEPADLLADAYWLEQADNKKTVEDRHWRRVFPQDPELYMAASQTLDRALPDASLAPVNTVLSTDTTLSDSKTARAEHDHLLSSAQQKFRALQGHHRRQSSSLPSQDYLRMHRSSISDSSDTDSDRRRLGRLGAPGGAGQLLLERQMMDMLAQEQREQSELHSQTLELTHSAPLYHPGTAPLMTPEKERPRFFSAAARGHSHSRSQSKTELSESDSRVAGTKPRQPSPPRPTRASLEVPQWGRRPSIDDDTSVPTSPELRGVREDSYIPAIGMDLSPTNSRPSSPSRNPISKVKSMFRERSRERTADMNPHHIATIPIAVPASGDRVAEGRGTERRASLDRRGSRSPPRKLNSQSTADAGLGKVHRIATTGLGKRRGEDSSMSLRGLLRGPRIDTVLRSGVSKVSDMIWRKEGEAGDSAASDTSSDESDQDQRGRDRGSIPSQASSTRGGRESLPGEKHYLDIMPQFVRASDHARTSSSDRNSLSIPGGQPASRPPSRRSSRFDSLKPPRIDVQDASGTGTSSPLPEASRRLADSDVSEAGSRSRKSSYIEGVRQADARLNAMLTLPESRRFSAQTIVSQEFAVSDRGDDTSPARQPVSKFELARMRTLVLSRGILAMEIDRRAKERKLLAEPTRAGKAMRDAVALGSRGIPGVDMVGPPDSDNPSSRLTTDGFSWAAIVNLCPEEVAKSQLRDKPLAENEVYAYAARVLSQSTQSAAEQWGGAADRFQNESAPSLLRRAGSVRQKASELSEMIHFTADEADEVSRDVITSQRLKIKRVVDIMDKMLRRRRRRFRWLRRAGWLAVEWVLVGFMWYVWFVVMIARIFLGVGKGLLNGVRWLLWL